MKCILKDLFLPVGLKEGQVSSDVDFWSQVSSFSLPLTELKESC